jgi:uncharacterized protein YrrD
MRKGSDIIGKPIVAYDTGEKVGRVRDLIFDQERNYLVALLVKEGGFMSDAKVLPLSDIQSIGMDAAIVSRADKIVPAKSDPNIANILARNNIMNGTHIMTVSGQDLGRMVDLYFDETTGAIEDARRAEMLEVLLSSVYTKTPEFSEATLRAPEPGRSSLPINN